MNKAYYQEYFDLERTHWWFRARSRMLYMLIASLRGTKKKNILNVGAATGATSLMLEDFGTVTSLEYDKECCEFTSSKLGMEIINGSITELPFPDNHFDIVCAFDVIEHVEDHELAAKELCRVCSPEGFIVATVPAYRFLWSHHDEVNQHMRRYTLNEFRKLFKGNKHVYSGYFNFFLLPLIALLRMTDNIFKMKSIRRNSGSDFTIIKSKTLNSFFYHIMLAEKFFISKRISLPAGVSIVAVFQKQH
jgi:ubiquinone/menaquinone biosynthesis C-methylase UbiE